MASSKEYNRIWRIKNKEKVRESKKQWKIQNPEKVKEYNKRYKDKYKERIDIEKKNFHLKKSFNISFSEYSEISLRQNNVCAICSKKCATGRNLAVDHNHQTGIIRGLLCMKCNRAIGLFCDDINIIRKALMYLN